MTDVLSAKLDEMLAGLEGVTPGPWAVDAGKQESLAIRAGTMQIAMVPGYGQGARKRLAEHIARCDPDTMRQIITLAKQALSLPITAEPGVVKVKPLEWQNAAIAGLTRRETAHSVVGVYAAEDQALEIPHLDGLNRPYRETVGATSFVAAKAAAQADYEARILSTLTGKE